MCMKCEIKNALKGALASLAAGLKLRKKQSESNGSTVKKLQGG